MGRVVLSTGLAGMSGVVGDLLFEQRAGGTVAKARPTASPKRTPGQVGNERRMAWLAVAWHALNGASFEAWRSFSEAAAVRNPATGAWVSPNPYNLFCKYAGKVRQVDPSADLAGFRPPAAPFGGDSPIVDCRFSIDDSGPGIAFTSTGANAEGVVTELLTQPLVNARRRVYRDRYVSRGFVAFAGAGTFEVPCEVGAWACAYRFVRAAAGQETALFELGVVEVGG